MRLKQLAEEAAVVVSSMVVVFLSLHITSAECTTFALCHGQKHDIAHAAGSHTNQLA